MISVEYDEITVKFSFISPFSFVGDSKVCNTDVKIKVMDVKMVLGSIIFKDSQTTVANSRDDSNV